MSDFAIKPRNTKKPQQCEICGRWHKQSSLLHGRFCEECCDVCSACNGAGEDYNGPCWDCQGQGMTPNFEGSKQMDTDEIITVMQLEAGAKLYGVELLDNPNGKIYTFKETTGLPIGFNDLVVVEVRNTFALGKVLDVGRSVLDVGCPLGALKHIVAVLPLDQFELLKTKEREAKHKLAMAEVSKKLNEYRALHGDILGQASRALGIYPQPEPQQPPAAPDDGYRHYYGKLGGGYPDQRDPEPEIIEKAPKE